MAENTRKINLLILTQKVDINDPILGFFHRWVEEFAKYCDKLTVICLQKGEYNLPQNVKVLSLGKESGESKIKYLLNFYKYIWQERKNYDSVFVHMNPVYVLLGGFLWKVWGKRICLWYTHKTVDLKLKISEKFVDKIFTASKESCRLRPQKVEATGHGIDLEKFNGEHSKEEGSFRLISVGRISPIKNYETLIEAAKILKDKKFDFSLKIAGAPIFEKDKEYLLKLNNLLASYGLVDLVEFVGPVSYKKIEEFYREGDLFINLSDTGSIDKVVLEAMASGLKVLTSNEAFKDILRDEYFTVKNSQKIAEKIIELSKLETGDDLKNYVTKNHNLENLISIIIKSYA